MTKQRSPNYPALGLSEAVDALRELYEKEKRTSVPSLVAAKALGYSSLSGPARVKLATLKKYGLLDGDDRTGLRISELGMRVLFPASHEDEQAARQKAALTPELFRELFDNYRDGSDEAIRSYLITRLRFAPIGAKQVISAFRDTLSFANLSETEYNASTMSDKTEARSSQVSVAEPAFSDLFRATTGRQSSQTAQPSKVYSWPLSDAMNVEVKFTGGKVTTDDLQMLVDFLEVAKRALERTSAADRAISTLVEEHKIG